MQIKTGLLSAACLAVMATLATSQVVINELVYDGTGSDDGQTFIEIFGPVGTDVSGYRIQSKEGDGTDNNESFVFPAGTLIPASGVLVVADELGSTGTTLVAFSDFIIGDMDPENGGDGFHLFDAADTLIDAMAYGATSSPIGEGVEARDIFAPLSLERCPGGSDTGDNFTDFTPNFPTPGVAPATCSAMEWVNLGFSNTISASLGEGVGLDFWLTGAPNTQYFVLWTCFDPGPQAVPFDNFCTPLALSLANTAPFIAWSGTLDANGHSVGAAGLDFATSPIGGLPLFDVWVGALAFNPSGPGFFNTNNILVTVEP